MSGVELTLKNLTAAFQDLGLFPPLVIRMLRIGENTGALDKALVNVTSPPHAGQRRAFRSRRTRAREA